MNSVKQCEAFIEAAKQANLSLSQSMIAFANIMYEYGIKYEDYIKTWEYYNENK